VKPPIAVVDTDVVVAGLLTRDLASPLAQGLDGMLAGLISTARMGAFDALCHLGIAAMSPHKIRRLRQKTRASVRRSSPPCRTPACPLSSSGRWRLERQVLNRRACSIK